MRPGLQSEGVAVEHGAIVGGEYVADVGGVRYPDGSVKARRTLESTVPSAGRDGAASRAAFAFTDRPRPPTKPMRRLLALVLPALAALMLWAAPTYATDSVSATATASGTTIQAEVSGIAEDCGSSGGCAGQAVAVVVQPDPENLALCVGNVGSGVIAEQSVPATGGSFSVSGSITEPEGTYAVCGYLSMSRDGASVLLAASNVVVVTMVPQPCPSGTPQPLSLTVPAKLAYGQRGAVGVSDRIAGVGLASVVLAMNVAGRPQPFSTYAFSAGDIASIKLANTKTFSTHVARGSAPTVVSLSSLEIATTTCTMSLSAEITPVAGALPVARFDNKPPGGRSGARVVFSAPGGCSLTAAVPASVMVTGRGTELTVSATNVCGRWRRGGRIPGVSVGLKAGRSGEVIGFHPSSGTSGTFRVTVRVDGRVVRRGVLHASSKHGAKRQNRSFVARIDLS